MTSSVVWSSNLHLAVRNSKEKKAVSLFNDYQEQAVTTVEEQAIQKQLLSKSPEDKIKTHWM